MVDLGGATTSLPGERRASAEGREPRTDGRDEENRIGIGLGLGSSLLFATMAVAQPAGEPRDLPLIGIPVPGGINYQPAVTEVAHDMHWLSAMVHGIMIAIVIFVIVLIGIVVVRFNKRRQPVPARWTHNTRIEIAWTLIPVVILILIGSFSLPILFKQLEVPPSDLTIKATGNQWYWSYNYPANDVNFDALILDQADLASYGYPPRPTCSPPTTPSWCRSARSSTCWSPAPT